MVKIFEKVINGKIEVQCVNEQIKHLDLPINTIVGKCPKCNEFLIIKEGKFGKFVGCAGFKNGCKNTYQISTFRVFNHKLLNKLNIYDANNKKLKCYKIINDREYFNDLDSYLKKVIKENIKNNKLEISITL